MVVSGWELGIGEWKNGKMERWKMENMEGRKKW